MEFPTPSKISLTQQCSIYSSPIYVQILSTATTAVLMILFMLINANGPNDYEPNMDNCTCSCFDRKFKGLRYKSDKQYRHIYFNLTINAAMAFMWSAGHFALLLAWVARAMKCLEVTVRARSILVSGGLRWSALCLGSLSLYGLVYGWWVVFNYINDAHHWTEIGVLWPTQLFFSATDLIPAYACYILLAVEDKPSNQIVLLSVTSTIANLFLALLDQGFGNILALRPLAARDAMFLLSDLAALAVIVPHMGRPSHEELLWMGSRFVILCGAYWTLKWCVGSF